MKLQISIISLLLISSALAATSNFAYQMTTGTGAWSFTDTAGDAAYFSQYQSWMLTPKHKNAMDFWTGMTASCAEKKSFDATSDTEVDSWAAAFDGILLNTGGAGTGNCKRIFTTAGTLLADGTTPSSDAAFKMIPFAIIKCYEELKGQLAKQPTALGDAYLGCLKAGIEAIGYNVETGLIGQFFRRSFKTWTAAQITQSTWDAMVTANTDGKTYTNAAYSRCAEACESDAGTAWVDEGFTGAQADRSAYQGIMPQQMHKKQLEVAAAACEGTAMKADADPQDAFDSAIGTAMNKCVDALELWVYDAAENYRMQCYRSCANPVKPMALAVGEATIGGVDGEIHGDDGEYIRRKRTIIANYVGCIQKISTQTKTAINALPESIVWRPASEGGANPATYWAGPTAPNSEESALSDEAEDGMRWQWCMQRTTECQSFAKWAMKDYEWAMDLTSDAEKCAKECTPLWVNGKTFDAAATPNAATWTGQSGFALEEYNGKAAFTKMGQRDQCIATLKSEWEVERKSWVSGQRNSGSILVLGSIIAMVFGLLF